MTTSIRTKLFTILSGLMLFFVLLSLGLTQAGLEKYYTWQKKDILITNSTAIDDLYHGNPAEIALELERVANILGAGVMIFTKDNHIKYSSFSPLRMPENDVSFPPPPPSITKDIQKIDIHTVLEMEQDQNLRINFMILKHEMNNGDILIIRQPLALISESVTVAGQFIVLTGLLSIVTGCIWAFFFAKKFTHPLLELNRIAQSMSQLNFSQKCTINHSDEFGELGKSINHLSDQLDTAISELNHKNAQLMADVEKERKLDKMRKDFVSSVSHELKTPLSLILGYAEGLKENIAQDEKNKNYYCCVIMDEAEKMDKLVKDLLNLSQIESGFYQLKKSDFNLSVLLSDISLKYLTILAEKDITLIIDKKVCWVNGDILRIEQVLLNLLNNAIEHAQFTKTINIFVENRENCNRVFVYNSGRQIPEESLDKIWTSFYKVDRARTRDHGRYGLGLSIVRAIQELHGYPYGVENTEDGVMFWFDVGLAKIKE